MADWDFTFSINNTNEFGWSYGFKPSIYFDAFNKCRDDYVDESQIIHMAVLIPTFLQGGKN